MDGSFLGRRESSLDRSTAGTRAQRVGRYEFGAPAALIPQHGLVRRAQIAMAPEDREANLLIAVAAPVNASAVPPLGAAEAGASATACTGSRHCSPRSTLHSPGPHRVSHAPRPSGFLGFLKYSCTNMPIDLDIHLAFDNCAAPSIPRSRTGSRCDHASFYTPLSHTSHHTQSTPPGSIGRGLLRAPDRTYARLWRPAVLLRAFDPGFPG
jgi:hypothetical protein